MRLPFPPLSDSPEEELLICAVYIITHSLILMHRGAKVMLSVYDLQCRQSLVGYPHSPRGGWLMSAQNDPGNACSIPYPCILIFQTPDYSAYFIRLFRCFSATRLVILFSIPYHTVLRSITDPFLLLSGLRRDSCSTRAVFLRGSSRLYVSIGGWSILWVAFNSYIFPICYCIRVERLWFLYTSLSRRRV